MDSATHTVRDDATAYVPFAPLSADRTGVWYELLETENVGTGSGANRADTNQPRRYDRVVRNSGCGPASFAVRRAATATIATATAVTAAFAAVAVAAVAATVATAVATAAPTAVAAVAAVAAATAANFSIARRG